MRILFGITALGLGGAEVVTIDLANRMSAMGHTVTIVSLSDRNEMGDRISDSVQVHLLGMENSPWGFIRGLTKAKSILKLFQPDVVHSNMVHANIFFRILRIITPIRRLVCSAHNTNEGGVTRMLLYRFTDHLSDTNTNVSNEALERFIKIKAFSSKTSLHIYNGIDTKRFVSELSNRTSSLPSFKFVNVGRLTAQKDHRNLLEAFKIICNQISNCSLTIVGGGELAEELASYARALGVEQYVHFTGAQRSPLEYYQQADCFVLSSRFEGFGIVLAEAMACELPVITTDAGGCAEVVGDREWVVPVKSPELLANKMVQCMQLTDNQRKEIGIKNRQRVVENFDINTIVHRWLKIYSGDIGKK